MYLDTLTDNLTSLMKWNINIVPKNCGCKRGHILYLTGSGGPSRAVPTNSETESNHTRWFEHENF